MKKISACVLLASVSLLLACEEEKAVESASEAQAAQIDEAPIEPVKPELSEEEKKAIAEEEEKEREQAAVEANPLTECCRALGKQAFTLRSPEYHNASKKCGEALEANKQLAAVTDDLKDALKGKAFPSECSP